MNYIKQLESDLAGRVTSAQHTQNDIDDFVRFLHSDKFTGTETDGSRKDWISTGDVLRMLAGLRGQLQPGSMPHTTIGRTGHTLAGTPNAGE